MDAAGSVVVERSLYREAGKRNAKVVDPVSLVSEIEGLRKLGVVVCYHEHGGAVVTGLEQKSGRAGAVNPAANGDKDFTSRCHRSLVLRIDDNAVVRNCYKVVFAVAGYIGNDKFAWLNHRLSAATLRAGRTNLSRTRRGETVLKS